MNRKKSLAAILALSAALMAMCLFAACSETAETESAISVSTPAAGSSTPADSSSDACSVPSMSRTPIPGRAESSSGEADSESVLSRPPESSAMPESRAQPVPSSRPAPAQPSASSSQAPVPEPTPQPVPEPPPPAPPPAPSVDVQACIDWGNAYAASLNMGVNGSLAIGAAGFENPIETGGKTEQQIKDHLTYQLNGIHAMWQSIPEYDPNIVVPCYSIVLSGTQIYVLYG